MTKDKSLFYSYGKVSKRFPTTMTRHSPWAQPRSGWSHPWRYSRPAGHSAETAAQPACREPAARLQITLVLKNKWKIVFDISLLLYVYCNRYTFFLLTLIRVASQPILKEWLVGILIPSDVGLLIPTDVSLLIPTIQCHAFGTVKNCKNAWLWELGWGT